MILLVMTFVAWSLVHSLTAGPRLKTVVRHRIGERAYEGWYRLLYNLFSLVTFLPVLWALATAVPNPILYRVPAPWSYAFLALQLAGLLGLLYAAWQTDVWAFVGVRQALRYLSGEPHPSLPPQFVTSGPYAWVRHPLYTFSLMVLWFSPVMALNSLVFNVLATLYFWIGSVHEERQLEREFGAAYEAYQARVPRLLPLRWPASRQGG